jgi:hypothetical protein
MHSPANAVARSLKSGLRQVLPAPARHLLRRVVNLVTLPRGRARLTVGIEPLSQRWEFDRGMPLHRFFLEQFLQECSSDIRGHGLEFQQDEYATRF